MLDVYSHSSKSWRSGRVFAIGKTSGYPREVQEDALTVAYGEGGRSRKILPRSSTELRSRHTDHLNKDAEQTPALETVLENQSHSPPPSVAPAESTQSSEPGEKTEQPEERTSHQSSQQAPSRCTNLPNLENVDSEKQVKTGDSGPPLHIPKVMLPKVPSIPENMAVSEPTPTASAGGDTPPLHTSKDTASERRPARHATAPAPSTKKPTAETAAPRRTSKTPKWLRWFSRSPSNDTAKSKKSPSPASDNAGDDKTRQKGDSNAHRKSSLERKSEERATSSEAFTVTNQMESLPEGEKEKPSKDENGKIAVLDKLKVDVNGKQREVKKNNGKTSKSKRKKKSRPHPQSDDERLPNRLPPDHTVDIMDPNTQRRLSRIRHHLVIKARMHSPA